MAKQVDTSCCYYCKHSGAETNHMVFCPFLNHYRVVNGRCKINKYEYNNTKYSAWVERNKK